MFKNCLLLISCFSICFSQEGSNKTSYDSLIYQQLNQDLNKTQQKSVKDVSQNNTKIHLYVDIINKDKTSNSGYVTKIENDSLTLSYGSIEGFLRGRHCFSINYLYIDTLFAGNFKIASPVTQEKIESIPINESTTKQVKRGTQFKGLPSSAPLSREQWHTKQFEGIGADSTFRPNKIEISNEKIFFSTITIIGGVFIGVCEIISVEHPYRELNYTIAVSLPVAIVTAGIALLCK